MVSVQFPLLERAVEAVEARHEEEMMKGLLGEGGAPIPARGETTVYARASIVKVIGAGAVEGVPEKVLQNRQLCIHAQTHRARCTHERQT